MFTGETSIRERVSQALLNDERTREAVIEVSGERGSITLMGRVPSQEIAQAAEEIARQQDGVVNVISELRIG